MRAVNRAPLKADTMQAGLYDDVLLGVNTPADFVPFPRWYIQLITEAANLKAVPGAGGSAIIARGQYMFVSDRHGANMMPAAG